MLAHIPTSMRAMPMKSDVNMMVPRMRLELIRPCGHCPLKTACLPFHHLGISVFGDRIANIAFGERPLGRILQSFEFVLQVANPYPEPPKTLPATSAAPAALCLSCSKFRVTQSRMTRDILSMVAQVGLEPTTSWL